MLKTVVTLAAVVALAGSAAAGERDRYGPPPAAARYYGPVNNYYGPVTIYAAPDAGGYAAAPASSYPAYGTSYGPGPATAPACDANCYGAGYDGSHGYGYSSGGYAYPAYGRGYGYGYPPANEGARMDPWNGYNGGFDNGYW